MIEISKWYENLPENCPPSDSLSPSGHIFYRLVSDIKNASDELISQREEFPSKIFSLNECLCRSVSIFAEKKDCEKVLKFPRHKHKSLLRLELKEKDGKIKKTFKNSHYSWWRSLEFKIEK